MGGASEKLFAGAKIESEAIEIIARLLKLANKMETGFVLAIQIWRFLWVILRLSAKLTANSLSRKSARPKTQRKRFRTFEIIMNSGGVEFDDDLPR